MEAPGPRCGTHPTPGAQGQAAPSHLIKLPASAFRAVSRAFLRGRRGGNAARLLHRWATLSARLLGGVGVGGAPGRGPDAAGSRQRGAAGVREAPAPGVQDRGFPGGTGRTAAPGRAKTALGLRAPPAPPAGRRQSLGPGEVGKQTGTGGRRAFSDAGA